MGSFIKLAQALMQQPAAPKPVRKVLTLGPDPHALQHHHDLINRVLDKFGDADVDWRWVVVPNRPQFDKILRSYDAVNKTQRAVTDSRIKTTYILADALDDFYGPRTLAHEYGHKKLGGGSEDGANKIAEGLMKQYGDGK